MKHTAYDADQRMPLEVTRITDGNGKFNAAVYETKDGYTVVRADSLLNEIINGKGRIHRDAADLIAQRPGRNTGVYQNGKYTVELM